MALTIFLTCAQGIEVEAAIANKPGDIIITNSTSSKGITGHIGIYIDSTTILHTSGWKSEPYPTTISEKKWHERYAKSKVIRPTSSKLGQDAAKMAKKYFKDKKINYKITANPKDINPNTYCSELVWYSYYKAGKQFKVFDQAMGMYMTPSIIKPYAYLESNNVSHNGFKFIDNKW